MTIETDEIQSQIRDAEKQIYEIATNLKMDLYKKGIIMAIKIEIDPCSNECWPKRPYIVSISAGIRTRK